VTTRKIASSLILLSIIFTITLASATTENNYKNDINMLPAISESTHIENGYKANIIINPTTTGIYAKENGYNTEFTINPKGIGGKLAENNYRLDLIPEKTFPDTILNFAPSIDGVNITPDPAYTTSTLIATPYGWYDAEGDPEGYLYQWQKWDGASWQDIPSATFSTLASDNFIKGDQIRIICTPYDGTDYGNPKEDTITISNSSPTIDSHYPLINPTIQEGESQEFNITKSDLDGDPLTVTWWLNQSDTEETSDSYTCTTNYESAGTYNITVVVSDSLSQTSHHWMLTVTNVERDIAIINVTLSKNIVGEGYTTTINITITNQGELHETFNVTAYANTTIIDTLTDITLPSGNSTTITFQWNTTGYTKGNYTITVYVHPVPGEADTTDNTYVDGWVFVTLPGDVDGDRDVDIFDIVRIAGAYGSKKGDPKYDPNYDIDGDGDVDIFDIVIACGHYGESW